MKGRALGSAACFFVFLMYARCGRKVCKMDPGCSNLKQLFLVWDFDWRGRKRALCDAALATPGGRRSASDPLNPPGHVSLVGKAGVGGDPTETIGTPGDAEPGVASPQFGAKHGRRNSVGRRESARHGFARKTVGLRPRANLERRIPGQVCQEQIRPIVFSTGGRREVSSNRELEQKGGLRDVLFSKMRQFVEFLQMIEPGGSVGIRPLQPDQLDAGGDHLIRVAIHRGMDQQITGGRADTARVAGFLKAAAQDDRRIGAQMAMPRQAEAARQGLYSGNDAAEVKGMA